MKALITGITGQDGYYLSNQLLEKDTKFMVWSEGHQILIQAESIH
jgi:GDP-D-mannose dehydratase